MKFDTAQFKKLILEKIEIEKKRAQAEFSFNKAKVGTAFTAIDNFLPNDLA